MKGLHKNAPQTPETETQRAAAFVNWQLPLADGTFLKAGKGFTIFQNPKFPNKHEDILVNLAKKNGGSVEVMLKCRVMINNGPDLNNLDLDNIAILPTSNPAAESIAEPATV